MPGELYVAGELISSGDPVVLSDTDGRLYSGSRIAVMMPGTSGTIIGTAGEQLRHGFRVIQRDGKYYEDDA